MANQKYKKTLPAEYHENALFLMIQGPKVLYAYWELSPGLKNTLGQKNNAQIRLNIEGKGLCQLYDFDLTEKSYYFENVQPGMSYNCEIGIFNHDNIFLPLLRSNTIFAPHDLPPEGPSGDVNSPSSAGVIPKAGD